MNDELHYVQILRITDITHDVRTFKLKKPQGYMYEEWQATQVSIDKLWWEQDKRPFTFTSLNTDDYLEFTIKMYDSHPKGMTKQLRELTIGDSLIIRDVRGAIHYQGKWVFIAWGAGVTPFIAILRMLRSKWELAGNILILSNKMIDDIILAQEREEMKQEWLQVMLTLTREDPQRIKGETCLSGRINEEFLKEHVSDRTQHF